MEWFLYKIKYKFHRTGRTITNHMFTMYNHKYKWGTPSTALTCTILPRLAVHCTTSDESHTFMPDNPLKNRSITT